MILYIDTTDFSAVTYALKSGSKIFRKSYKIDPHQSHKTLKILEEFLGKHQKPNSKIQKIIVNKGPGSYTGTRVGVTHAQALGFAWNIPVKFLEKEKFLKEFKKPSR
jgi:tRNA threonylcarbamoyladenosine biosynthesis protein TsaB